MIAATQCALDNAEATAPKPDCWQSESAVIRVWQQGSDCVASWSFLFLSCLFTLFCPPLSFKWTILPIDRQVLEDKGKQKGLNMTYPFHTHWFLQTFFFRLLIPNMGGGVVTKTRRMVCGALKLFTHLLEVRKSFSPQLLSLKFMLLSSGDHHLQTCRLHKTLKWRNT